MSLMICNNCGNSVEYTFWCCERKNWCCENCHEKCPECCEKQNTDKTNNKIRTMTIYLDKDYNENEAKQIASSIGMIRGVEYITVNSVDGEEIIAREVAKLELKKDILTALNKIL